MWCKGDILTNCIVALLDLCQHATAGVLPSNSVTVVSGM